MTNACKEHHRVHIALRPCVEPKVLIHVPVKLIERNASHGVAINTHFVRSPIQAEALVRIGNAGIPPDNQHRREPDVPIAEISFEALRLFEIIEHREPVDDLRKPMFKPLRPYHGFVILRWLENALQPAVFKFDYAELPVRFIA